MIVYASSLEEIAKQSLRNCHAQGLDSVMFYNKPGERIRAFVASPDHDLWHNDNGKRIHLAVHQHHCDVTLVPVFGETYNMRPRFDAEGERYEPYKYVSQITTGKGKMELEWGSRRFTLVPEVLVNTIHMKAHEEHTIYIPKGQPAAWFVYEGKENPNYDSTCWSNNALELFNFSQYYQPVDVGYLRWLLRILNVEVK
jgi:hypothetical protein